ncbi:MAG: ATPase, T2SS/T4P/T4SS family [Christensenellaceae bacterium]
MFEFLPERYRLALSYCNLNKLYEIRIRSELPVTVNYDGVYRYLTPFGVGDSPGLTAESSEPERIVLAATQYSIYSSQEQIRRGFFTTKEGVRIGVAGTGVAEQGQVLNVRDFTSLCIRIPHDVEGCADQIYEACLKEKLCHTLIISPPGFGKTTMLRDLAKSIGTKGRKNVLIIDERGELSSFFCGPMSDIIRCIDKQTSIVYGIRSMRPDVLITDEITDAELPALKRAVGSGVAVCASFHADKVEEAPDFFERYVVLGERIGKILGIYDQEKRLSDA